MAVTLVAVSGKVLLPDGTGTPGGTLVITLSKEGSVEDAGTGTQRVAAVKTVTIGSDGSVSFNVVPNDTITPSGTIYRADYKLPSGVSWSEYWDIASSPSSLEIGDIPLAAAAVSGREASIPSVSTLPAAGSTYRGRIMYLTGGAGGEDIAYVCLKTSSDTYDWVPFALGG